MAFHPETGDLWVGDNGIDEDDLTATSKPPQADELNVITADELGTTAPDFGFPRCYIEYETGSQIGNCTDVRMPVAVFQPIANSQAAGRTEGVTEIAFSPTTWPSPWNGGVFALFSGASGVGPGNDQNGVAYYHPESGAVLHFIESGTPTVGNLLGATFVGSALYIADWGAGKVYQITPVGQLAEAANQRIRR